MPLTNNSNLFDEIYDQKFNCLDLYTFLKKTINNLFKKYYFVIQSGSKIVYKRKKSKQKKK